MAAVDSLLKLAKSQIAEALTIVSDDVPTLLKGGILKKLTMPPISKELVMLFVEEVVGPRPAETQAEGCVTRGTYPAEDGSVLSYEIEQKEGRIRLTFRFDGHKEPEDEKGAALSGPASTADASPDSPATAGPAANDGRARPRDKSDPDAFASSAKAPLLALIERALDEGASDIFFSTGDYPRMRLRGEVEILHGAPVDEEEILSIAGAHLTAEQSASLEQKGSVDLAVSLDVGGSRHRFRVSLFSHLHGFAAALRPIRSHIPTLKELNFPVSLREICRFPNGLVLVTGASGAGKSTTLAALLEQINQTRALHIITLEDPIEFEHVNQRSLIHQRELGRHMDAFDTGLYAALRESPDVILLGEMRDPSTVAAALTAAETGHLVLSTLHTGDAVSAVDRIIDAFPGHQQTQARRQLASVLRVVLTQNLLPSTVPSGRVPAVEKLVVTSGVASHIRDGKSHQIASFMQAGGQDGMITMERSLADLVNGRLITMKTALSVARDEESLLQLVGSRR